MTIWALYELQPHDNHRKTTKDVYRRPAEPCLSNMHFFILRSINLNSTGSKGCRKVLAEESLRGSDHQWEEVTRRHNRSCRSAPLKLCDPAHRVATVPSWPARSLGTGCVSKHQRGSTCVLAARWQISCSAAVVPVLTQHPVSTLSSWPYRPLCVDSITNTSAGQQINWGSTHASPQSSTHTHHCACVRARMCVFVCVWVQGSNSHRSWLNFKQW